MSYIGKTKRHLATRVKEHRFCKSAVNNHLLSCNNCCNNFSVKRFKILACGRSDMDISIKEALLIKASNPALNQQLHLRGSSYFLNVF